MNMDIKDDIAFDITVNISLFLDVMAHDAYC